MLSPNSISRNDIELPAHGDWTLAATLHEPSSHGTDSAGPVVMISSAAGVPRWFYFNFADYLVESGARAAVTYDYRGIGGSSGDRKRWKSLHMKDWALLDFPSVSGFIKDRFSGCDMIGVGHSYGGQALGLSGVSDHFLRYATVATMSGYWADLDEPYSVWLRTQVLGRLAVKLIGHVPKTISPGEAMPGSIFLNWADWIAKPDYFFSDPELPETNRFKSVTLPYLSVGLDDDPWGTKKAVGGFMAHYTDADLRQMWLEPGTSGAIGHLGFFRQRHRETHWPAFRDFVLNGVFPGEAKKP